MKKFLLALLMVAFLGSAAWAVEVNPGGKGDALIFGYYNARNALTYFRLVNTSDNMIVGKIRFREAKRSEEVLDFVVCMSPKDEFSMILVDGGDTSPAVLYKGTDMISDADTTTVPADWTMVPLRYKATGAAATVEMDDTKEGYVEFIALSQVAGLESITSDQCKTLAENGSVDIGDTTYTAEDAADVVMGAAEIVSYGDNLPIFSYKATALSGTGTGVITSSPATGTDTPLFNSVLATQGGIGALNGALAKTDLYGMYDIRSALGAATDYVLSFPTKKETFASAPSDFDTLWTVVKSTESVDLINYCVTVKFDVYDDAENTIQQEIDFSPYQVQTTSLCYEVNYLTVGTISSPILSTGVHDVSIQTGTFDFGWLKIYFDNNDPNDAMPVIAYELQSWADGVLSRMVEMNYDPNTAALAD